ncbi:MAG TPA: hypothetical protein VNR89_03940 [Roseomonas sp.]|nr:hypothetical protein [Roseomonas sp.]
MSKAIASVTSAAGRVTIDVSPVGDITVSDEDNQIVGHFTRRDVRRFANDILSGVHDGPTVVPPPVPLSDLERLGRTVLELAVKYGSDAPQVNLAVQGFIRSKLGIAPSQTELEF